jgi:hypothetical protein
MPALRQVYARTADGTREMGEPVTELWRANAMVGRLLQTNGVLNAWHAPVTPPGDEN